jgi:histidyl-tRNA synthetase
MAAEKTQRVKARVARGFADRQPLEIAATRRMLETIRQVFELYGFEAVETPLLEYTDALGKFLPDLDRPNEGVFSFQDDDEQWLSLRYDLTAPLARYVAEHFNDLPKPYRSYRAGYVFRNEKPGPGRFRQFMQFDADTVGAPSVAADAEFCMLAADTMEKLGIPRGSYVVRVNNRKVLEGVMEAIGLAEGDPRRLIVLRAIDKLDKFGPEGVSLLLGAGRKDESGDFTKGAGLDQAAVDRVLGFTGATARQSGAKAPSRGANGALANFESAVGTSETGRAGVAELSELAGIVAAAGYGDGRIVIDPSVVRGLEYYTGPVYEVELTFEVTGEEGRPVRFGSVAGGGRYDGLVARFRGEAVPATGFSIGVSRLLSALTALGKVQGVSEEKPLVVVCVMDRERFPEYQAMATDLRQAGIRAEVYLGGSGMKAQLKYADRRRAALALIQGSDEAARGEVQIKDLALGAEMAKGIADNQEWREARVAQKVVRRERLVSEVKAILAAG